MSDLDNEAFLAAPASATPANNRQLYPKIPLPMLSAFRQVQAGIRNDPRYLQDMACPYPPIMRSFLEELFLDGGASAEQIAIEVDEFFGADDEGKAYDIIVRDAKRAYMTLGRVAQKMELSSKPEEQITRIKSVAQLQERLLAIMEKAEGNKQIHQFRRVVLDVIEHQLTPDQRTGIMTEIQKALEA